MNAIKIFENKQVRSVWDSEREKWYISVVDVIEVLTESTNPRRYWSDLKIKLEKEGSQLYEKIVSLKVNNKVNNIKKAPYTMEPFVNVFFKYMFSLQIDL
jgi:hypothetical protein